MNSLREHWKDYLIEGAGLGLFMISAAVFTTAFEYHNSPLYQSIPNPTLRRGLIGIAMGLTAILIIYSPWGQRSGAHLNPAVTLTYYRLGRIEATDAIGYIISQFLGGIAGVYLGVLLLGEAFTGQDVKFAITAPGWGLSWAFGAEFLVSFIMMTVILNVSNKKKIAGYTGIIAGILIAIFITTEAPISGMSMNPARSVASAVPAHVFQGWWVYFIAPIFGMLLASEFYIRTVGYDSILCAKLHHGTSQPCLFKHCKFSEMKGNSNVESL